MVAEDIVARITLERATGPGGEGNILLEIIPSIIRHTGAAPSQRISLPPSIFPSIFGIAVVQGAEGIVRVFGQDTILHPGLYYVFVEVMMERKAHTALRGLKVWDKPPFAEWMV
ncbi:hypothetical protein ES703_113690 [subsurface metagenome]